MFFMCDVMIKKYYITTYNYYKIRVCSFATTFSKKKKAFIAKNKNFAFNDQLLTNLLTLPLEFQQPHGEVFFNIER